MEKIECPPEWIRETSFENEKIIKVNQQSLELLARHAFHDISHYLRSSHLGQLRKSLMIQMLLQMIALSLLIC